MKIITYNVNGIRAAMNKDLVGWLKAQTDVLCLQRKKQLPTKFDVKTKTWEFVVRRALS